jgi:hypothetical protein
MKRIILAFLVQAVVVTIVALPALPVAAAGLIPCGGAGEPACQACHITQLINNVVAWLFIVLSIVAAILIAIAGFKLVMSGGNAGARSAAKETFVNIFIGFIILMGGWIIIDTFMKALVTGQVYGVWNQIQCVSQPGVNNAPAGSGFAPGSPWYTGVTGGGRGTGAQCAEQNVACSVEALRATGMSAEQANIMSCIAMTESSGNPNFGPYNTRNPGSNSTACGTFQITQTTWRGIRNPPSGCEDFSQCTNYNCNMQMAHRLSDRSRTGYGDWTCPNCNTRAQGCIDRYRGAPGPGS